MIVDFNPHEDGTHCGKCERTQNFVRVCSCPFHQSKWKGDERHPLCVAAERKLSALVKAGTNLAVLWDAEVGKSGENTEASAAFFAAVAKMLG